MNNTLKQFGERNEQYIKTNLWSEFNNTLTQIYGRNEQYIKTNLWAK